MPSIVPIGLIILLRTFIFDNSSFANNNSSRLVPDLVISRAGYILLSATFLSNINSELILDRKVADKRIYPALDITRSGTRREELLFAKDELSKMNVLRRIISPMGTMDGIEFLISKLKNTKNNSDFFDSMNKSAN